MFIKASARKNRNGLSKSGALIFSLIFALGFGAGGAASLYSLAKELSAWWQARSWTAVSADVIEVDLNEHRGKSTTHEARTRYRYTVNGKTYDNTRIGFTAGSDNIGDWQQRQFRQLRSAKTDGTSIQIWVDPSNPSHAVVDRNLRWKHVVFMLPFVTLFPLVGVIAAWIFVKTLIAPATELTAKTVDSNPEIIHASADSGARPLWFFAIFWSLLAFPIAAIAIPDLYGRSLMWLLLLLLLLFPLIGIVMLANAMTKSIRLARNGDVTLSIDPRQPRLGNAVKLSFTFEKPPSLATHTIALICESVNTTGKSTRYQNLWRQERQIQPFNMSGRCQFHLPTNVPASESIDRRYCRWRAELTFPDGNDTRAFDLTVLATASGTAEASQEEITSIPNPQTLSIPAAIATITDEFSRLHIDFNPARQRSQAIGTMVFGSIFFGIPVFMISRTIGDGPGMFAAPFLGVVSLVGIAIILLGVVTLTRRFSVHIEQGRLIAVDKTLLRNNQHDVAIDDVVKLIPTRRDTGNRVGHYRINVTLKDGREINLADNIHDTQMAGAFVNLLQRHLHLPDAAVGSLAHAGLAEQQRCNTSMGQADGARLRKRVIVGAAALQLAVMAGIGWRFFSPNHQTAPTVTQAPSPSPHSTLNPRDQALFDSLHNVASNSRIPEALDDGANINATNDWGATPLMIAAGLGDTDDSKLLIRSGANINFAVTADNEYKGRTALMQAAHAHQSDTVALLMDAGADATITESHGWSAMHYAARNGDAESLRIFKKHGVNLDQPSPVSRGETPLMIAARSGEIDAIKALIALGADPHLKDRFGENAYGWAKYFNQPEAMTALLPYQ